MAEGVVGLDGVLDQRCPLAVAADRNVADVPGRWCLYAQNDSVRPIQCCPRRVLCSSWARVFGQIKIGIRVDSAWRQRVPVARQRQLQDALLGTCSREEWQLQRDVHPGWLHSANGPGPRHLSKRALVLFRGRRDQPEPGDGDAQIGAWRADWKTIAASARGNRVLAASRDQQRLSVNVHRRGS